MKRSRRMQIVQSVAEHEELEERKIMASSQKQLEAAFGRLEELRAYRSQYAVNSRPPSGACGVRWQDYHKFMHRLDQAMLEQEHIVADGRIQREAHKNRWMLKRQRLDSMSKIIDRFRGEETEAEERQLQKQQDAIPKRPGPFDRSH